MEHVRFSFIMILFIILKPINFYLFLLLTFFFAYYYFVNPKLFQIQLNQLMIIFLLFLIFYLKFQLSKLHEI